MVDFIELRWLLFWEWQPCILAEKKGLRLPDQLRHYLNRREGPRANLDSRWMRTRYLHHVILLRKITSQPLLRFEARWDFADQQTPQLPRDRHNFLFFDSTTLKIFAYVSFKSEAAFLICANWSLDASLVELLGSDSDRVWHYQRLQVFYKSSIIVILLLIGRVSPSRFDL